MTSLQALESVLQHRPSISSRTSCRTPTTRSGRRPTIFTSKAAWCSLH